MAPLDVAKVLMLAAIYRLEYLQTCDFCEAGQPADDGGDKEHTDECPFFGFDHTKDVDVLKDWATGQACADKGET